MLFVICGHRIYKTIWTPEIDGNYYDSYAVSV